jgi:hypothetical protein
MIHPKLINVGGGKTRSDPPIHLIHLYTYVNKTKPGREVRAQSRAIRPGSGGSVDQSVANLTRLMSVVITMSYIM